MTRLEGVSRGASTALLLLLFAATSAQAAGDRDRLVGTWRYQKEVVTTADGAPIDEAAIPSEGFLVYTSDGQMAVQILPKGRHWTRGKPTFEELRQTLDEGTSYAGRFEVDPKAKTVTHHVEICLDPSFEGKSLVRHYSFRDGALLLSGDATSNGKPIRFTITWVRAGTAR